MEEFICFPVTLEEKQRFLKMCSALGIKSQEWFRLALIESEINIKIRNYPDPDLPQKDKPNSDDPDR